MLADASGALQVELQAGVRQGREHLQGELQGGLKFCCQRCERSFEWPLRIEMDLLLVHSEEEEAAALQDAEPYWVQDDELPLQELIEDEVLLALPMLPRCESCENAVKASAAVQEAAVEQVEERVNPFLQLQEEFKKRH
ncbi:uncharacterized protein SAMN04488038_101502 [Solimonas aquatica]|uniref:Large ribosomal RNA subunit accumulation protein YceD n=1 Tax=Solimonas aquatica TaxID=489703 RepID=A0A1H9ATA0_9GAMM|nr:uncharacterized protein SAMN04488038_101502 [Solimonas aquatica]